MSSAPLVAQFEADLQAVLAKYADSGLTLAETVGTLETVKMETYLAARENDAAELDL